MVNQSLLKFLSYFIIFLRFLGLIILVLLVVGPILAILLSTPSPGGGGGEACDPGFFSSINPC